MLGSSPSHGTTLTTTIHPLAAASPPRLRIGIDPSGRWVAMAAGLLIALALTLPKALQVWQTGIFHDPDDAMRAVVVRDFLAGQGWFDLVQHRLSPNHPFTMHWSRLVDLPLAVMVRAFGLLLSPAMAELAMRLLEPVLLLALSLAVVTGMARDLMGRRAMLPAAVLLAGSTQFVGNFVPGHIHHHGFQAALLLVATRLTMASLRPTNRTGGSGLAAGATLAFSLGIGLQNLPFVIALAAVVAFTWVARGNGQRNALAGFGLGLAATSICVFLLDVSPSAYLDGACDAFSMAHLLSAGALGACFAAAALATPRLTSWPLRLAVASVSTVVVLGLVAATYPACLRDPMAGVDPLLRSGWLADVGEALPLFTLIGRAPGEGSVMLLTLLIGLGATALAAMQAERASRDGWWTLLALAAVGFAGTVWQIRVAPSACAFMIPGVTWSVLATYDVLSTNPRRPALLMATCLGMVVNGSGLAAAAAALTPATPAVPGGSGQALPHGDPNLCFEPGAYQPMAALPPGLVLSTIDPGSAILAYTHHSVLAAPYHRNTYGIRASLLAFAAEPATAQLIVTDSRAQYLAICRTSNEAAETARLHPDSLAAALLTGRIPDWLVRVGTGQDPVLLFRVVGAG